MQMSKKVFPKPVISVSRILTNLFTASEAMFQKSSIPSTITFKVFLLMISSLNSSKCSEVTAIKNLYTLYSDMLEMFLTLLSGRNSCTLFAVN